MNFLRLRADSHAQYEIRAYAEVMLDTLKKWVPTTFEAFMDYRVGGTEVSAKGKVVIEKFIRDKKISLEDLPIFDRAYEDGVPQISQYELDMFDKMDDVLVYLRSL